MLNRVMLIGNIGEDPTVRYTPGGDAITTISLATTRRWKDKNTNEKKSETEWHRVVFFGALAKIAGDYLKKGSQVYVAGRIRTQKWTDKEGQERFTTEIVADEMNMLGGKTGSYAADSQPSSQAPANSAPADGFDPLDDVPF